MEPRSRPSHLCKVTKLGQKVVPKRSKKHFCPTRAKKARLVRIDKGFTVPSHRRIYHTGVQGPVSQSSRKIFRTRKAIAKCQTFWLQLFYWHIPPLIWIKNRGSLHTRSFSHIHRSVFRNRLTKNGFAGLKCFRAFWQTSPRTVNTASDWLMKIWVREVTLKVNNTKMMNGDS